MFTYSHTLWSLYDCVRVCLCLAKLIQNSDTLCSERFDLFLLTKPYHFSAFNQLSCHFVCIAFCIQTTADLLNPTHVIPITCLLEKRKSKVISFDCSIFGAKICAESWNSSHHCHSQTSLPRKCHSRNTQRTIMPTDTDGTTWLRWATQSLLLLNHRHRTIVFRRASAAFTRRHTVQCQCQCQPLVRSQTAAWRCPSYQIVNTTEATMWAFNFRTASHRMLCQRISRMFREPTASIVGRNWDGILAALGQAAHLQLVDLRLTAEFMIQL